MFGVEIEAVDGAGAEVRCDDVSQLSDATFEQLETAFRDHGLLYLREQFVTDEALLAFARRWGSPQSDPEVTPHPRLQGMGIVQKAPLDTVNLGGFWHADRSFDARPPMGSLLLARELPFGGGSTKFASMHAAYDALDSSTRRTLESLRCVHRPLPDAGSDAHTTHPLVIRHPISGRAVLYANPAYTTGIVDMEPTEALGLLNQLFVHCTLPEFVHDFSWEPGSLVIWDNRSVMHFATNDYPGQTRTMHRVMIEGVPLHAAAAATPTDPTLAQRAGTTVAGAVVTAAMLGLGEVIEPEKARPDIEIVSEAPEPEPLDELDFGSLPPLA